MVATITMPSTAAAGSTITVTVSGVSPGEQVGGGFSVPPNTTIPVPPQENGIQVTANANGIASWQWHILSTAPVGTYQAFIAEASGEVYNRTLQVTSSGGGGGGGISQNTLLLIGLGVLAVIALTGRR